MQQSDKHGRVVDEALKHEPHGMEDQPMASTDTSGAMIGGTPAGMTPKEVEERSLLARYLGASVYPASKDDLIAKLQETNAPDTFVHRIQELPADHTYANVQDIVSHLGLHVETQRF